MIYNSLTRIFFSLFFYFLLCFFIPFYASAQQKPADIITEKSGIEEFKQSVAKAISNEKEKLDELKRQLSGIEETQKALKEELNACAIQISARNNLLLLPDTRIKDLEEARSTTQATIASISDKIKKFEQRAVTVDLLLLKATELFLVNESQLKEFKDQSPRTEAMQSIIKDLQVLSTLFSSKKATLDKIQQIHRHNIQEFNSESESIG
jgi:chromosome segregation ATPase